MDNFPLSYKFPSVKWCNDLPITLTFILGYNTFSMTKYHELISQASIKIFTPKICDLAFSVQYMLFVFTVILDWCYKVFLTEPSHQSVWVYLYAVPLSATVWRQLLWLHCRVRVWLESPLYCTWNTPSMYIHKHTDTHKNICICSRCE